MRVYVYPIAALLYPILSSGSPADYNVLSALAPKMPTVVTSSSGPKPTPVYLAPNSFPDSALDSLELRQAAGLAPVAAHPSGSTAAAVNSLVPAPVAPVPVALANQPAAALPAIVSDIPSPLAAQAPATATSDVAVTSTSQVVPPAPPATFLVLPRVTTTTPLPSLVTGDDFVNVQWVEAYISGLRTWIPETQTFHFEAMSQDPLPGSETLVMGTLTERIGQTQTIHIVAGAAPTHATDSKKVLAAAVAVGIAGLVV